jgi:putative oxidoreductase
MSKAHGSSRLARLVGSSPAQIDVALLVLRVWFGGVLAMGHGLGKIKNLGGFIDSVADMGFPLPIVMGPFAALSEFVGGLCLALGVMTRVAGAAVVGTMVGAAFVVHAADPFMKKEFALAYGCAALVLVIAGPGRYSVDQRWLSRR